MIGLQEIADLLEGPVVGQYGAEQRRLDFRIVRWQAELDCVLVIAAMERRDIRILIG
jgi:hypothetical protein